MKILYLVHNYPPYEYTGTPLLASQYANLALNVGAKVAVAFGASPASGLDSIVQRDGINLFPIAGSQSVANTESH